MAGLSRRQWLKVGVAGAVGAAAAPYVIPSGVLSFSANDRIAIGAIGIGERATLILPGIPSPGQLVALCDCNLDRAERFKAQHWGRWPVYQDYREILDRKDVDAVIVTTGEFQRVLPCIHACQAGKDIYAEKPLTLYIREGRVLVDAVRKYGRILQVGSQQRSMAMNRIACEFVRSGGLGRIEEVQARCYTGPLDSPSRGMSEQRVPAGFQWDVWLNQAAHRPFNYRWLDWVRWHDFSGGDATAWGAHGIDQIQWGLGMDGAGPVEMKPLTPGLNGQVEMRYENGVPVRFVLYPGPNGGCVFIGEKGKLEVNRNKFTSNPREIAAELQKNVDPAEEEWRWSESVSSAQGRWHMENWLACVRSRQMPVADVEIGHRSVTMCHLLNITRRLGRPLKWDPQKEVFLGDDEANQLADRPRRKGFELPTQI